MYVCMYICMYVYVHQVLTPPANSTPTPSSHSCIDRYHKHARAKAAARSPPPVHPPTHQQRFFLPPGTGAAPDPSDMGVGSPAATLFMASDELLPVLEYVVCLVRVGEWCWCWC